MIEEFKWMLLVFLISISIKSFCQNPIVIKGYVIDGTNVIPGVSVSVSGKDLNTETNVRGRFKIQCAIGDTLVFEHYNPEYKIEKYRIEDSSLIIIRLIKEVTLNKRGEYLYGTVHQLLLKETHSFQASINLSDENIYSIGYDYYIHPIFSDKTYIPIKNFFSMGINILMFNNKIAMFPNIGFCVKNSFNLSYTLIKNLAPEIKLGYLINDYNNNNKFGYEINIEIFEINYRMFNISLKSSYRSYTSRNGAIMIGLFFRKMDGLYSLPNHIKKEIQK